MKKSQINLHMNLKKALLLLILFSAVSFFANLLVEYSIRDDFSQLNSLMKSKYLYSVSMQDSIGENSYYRYSAGIGFALSEDSVIGINADVLMQAPDTEYTDMVAWHPESLDSNGLAISQNIADEYGLKTGDKLYSKHIATDAVCEYVIEEIIPDVSNACAVKGRNNNEGIIVMGYDSLYAENISHSCIVYTDVSLAELQNRYSDIPTDIVYREDEIATVVKSILPYAVLAIMIGLANSIILVSLLTRSIQYNFKRQIILGYDEKMLNGAFMRIIIGMGMTAVLAVAIMNIEMAFFTGNLKVACVIVASVSVMEITTFIISSEVLNRRLWRK